MKRFISIALIAATMLLLVSCGSSEPYGNYDLSDYVTLGKYVGVPVTVVNTVITEEDVTKKVESICASQGTSDPIDGPAQTGDTVVIDFEGFVDGEPLENGSAENQTLEIGNDSYIDGFADGIIGASVNETVTLNLEFPNPYPNNAELSGKPVVFNVTVKSISRLTPAEYTDEFVEKYTQGAYKTTEAYNDYLLESLKADAASNDQTTMISAVWNSVFEGSTIIKLPKKELKAEYDSMVEYYKAYATYVGTDFATYLSNYMGMTEEEFYEEANAYCENLISTEIIMYAIARAENIVLTDEEYQTGALEYAAQYDLESVEKLEEEYGKDIISQSLLWDKVLLWLLDHAEKVEPAE